MKLINLLFTLVQLFVFSEAIEWNRLSTIIPEMMYSTTISEEADIFQYIDSYFEQECECVELKQCKPVLDMISKFRRTPISHYLLEHLRKASCGFDFGQHLICCPQERGYNQLTTEAPWIWDIVKTTDKKTNSILKKTTSNRSTEIESDSSLFQNRFNYFPEDDYKQNLIDFEDPQTYKNCPPSFHMDYESNRVYPPKKYPHKNPRGPKYEIPPFFNDFPYPGKGPIKGGRRKPTIRPIVQTISEPELKKTTTSSPPSKNLQNRFSADSVNSPMCGVSVNTRIIGGNDAGPGEFPWMARIAYRNRSSGLLSYRCAGSVINNRHIVTAAHCVTNLIAILEVYLVRLGELEQSRTTDCSVDPVNCRVPQDFDIDRLISHPLYDTPKYANDIALIRLVRTLNTAGMTPICLPMSEFAAADSELTGKTGIVAGWASPRIGARRTSTLQYVQLPIVNRTQCAISYAQFSANSRAPIIVSASQICAQGRENLDACQGDSGGPLMTDGEESNSRYVLLGLVSFGPRTCGISNFPGVYTRVSAYIDWILENIDS